MGIDPAMQIRELMRTDVVTCRPDDQVDSALEIMRCKGCRHLPVIDQDNRVLGVVSDRDIRNVCYVYDSHSQTNGAFFLSGVTVEQIMTGKPDVVTADETVVRALEKLAVKKRGCLPVVAEDKVVGIVTTIDFLRLLHNLLVEASQITAKGGP